MEINSEVIPDFLDVLITVQTVKRNATVVNTCFQAYVGEAQDLLLIYGFTKKYKYPLNNKYFTAFSIIDTRE